MSTTMLAKFQLQSVEQFGSDGKVTGERLKFAAVPKSTRYPDDGSDEDNTYAKFTPNATCEIYVANPALFGKFAPGEKFYVEFTPAQP